MSDMLPVPSLTPGAILQGGVGIGKPSGPGLYLVYSLLYSVKETSEKNENIFLKLLET